MVNNQLGRKCMEKFIGEKHGMSFHEKLISLDLAAFAVASAWNWQKGFVTFFCPTLSTQNSNTKPLAVNHFSFETWEWKALRDWVPLKALKLVDWLNAVKHGERDDFDQCTRSIWATSFFSHFTQRYRILHLIMR